MVSKAIYFQINGNNKIRRRIFKLSNQNILFFEFLGSKCGQKLKLVAAFLMARAKQFSLRNKTKWGTHVAIQIYSLNIKFN